MGAAGITRSARFPVELPKMTRHTSDFRIVGRIAEAAIAFMLATAPQAQAATFGSVVPIGGHAALLLAYFETAPEPVSAEADEGPPEPLDIPAITISALKIDPLPDFQVDSEK